MAKLRITIDKFKQNIKDMIEKFNKVSEFYDIYYNINNTILTNF